MWFTSGNHEDFEALSGLSGTSGRQPDFVVDAYCRVRCIKDGNVIELDQELTVGALWGVDGDGQNRRTNLPKEAYISRRQADRLMANPFRVLLTHDAPVNAKRSGYGSETIADLIAVRQPAFAFFGHYRGAGTQIEGDFGVTRVYHMAGMELHGPGGSAESGSVGVLNWDGTSGEFEFISDDWLKTFTRHNWKWR